MFDKILGIPAHPLIIHAAVVFIPLLIAAIFAYALVPRVRTYVGWAAAALAVVAPFAAWFATLSGNRLRVAFIKANYPQDILDQVTQHKDYGDKTLWATIILAVLSAALLVLTTGWFRVPSTPRWVPLALTGLIVVFGLITAYYVFRTGDSGAHSVWKNAVP